MASSAMDPTPSQNITKEAIEHALVNQLVGFHVKTNGNSTSWKLRPLYETKSKDNYASTLYVAEMVDNNTGKLSDTSLIVKVLPEDLVMRRIQNSDKQFQNEKAMFLVAVPLLLAHSHQQNNDPTASLFPKCYYADCDPDNTMIIMENLKTQHFQLADLLLDYQHCKLSLEGLARLHALSYSMKHHHGDVFKQQVVDSFQEARFCDTNTARQNVYMRYTSLDPVNFILKSEDAELVAFRNKHSSFLHRLEVAFERTVDLMVNSVVPVEPLAVLCHGDFNRNNIMFRYDHGEPVQVKLLDFQTVRYANPATDFVFMFFLNTTAELRTRHRDALLSAYQKTLVEALVEMDVATREQLEEIYSLRAFVEDYERHALNGYVISAMFNHFMLGSAEEAKELAAMRELEGDAEEPSEAYLRKAVSLGGEEAMNRSVAIIKEMALMTHCFDYVEVNN